MAKKNDGNFQTSIPQGNVFITPIEDVMPQSMLPYAEFVILDRALPRVEDGLKPVQRRILYTMLEMGLTPDKPHKKSARIVGDCMGKYHPHGDSSVYDAMVRMAQDFNMRMTLVNGHGNFGSVDGDPAAAMRYTEARLEPLALELLKDLDKETVPFSFNFDDSLLEPDILPGRFPNLLVNGANGIAVGLATNIPTHNLGEVIDGVCAYIDNPRISLKEMMKIIPGPDFSTGGYIIANELVQAYETGKGKITLRAKYSVETGAGGKKLIVITELPYQTNKAELLRRIMLLKEDKKELLSGITDIVDESDRTGMRAVIACRKEADVDAILQVLFKYTDLECTFGINMVAIAGGKPQQLGLLDIIKYYVNYQRLVVLRRAKYELKEAQARRHIVEGLIVGVHNIDEVVKIIKNAESTPDARRKLMEKFSLSERQAQAILDLRLARLAKLEVYKLEQELEELNKKIAHLQKIIGDKNMQMEIVKSEIKEIKKKYPCPRRSEIKGATDDIYIKREDIKRAVTEWAVSVTADGRIKFTEKKDFISRFKKPLTSAKLSGMHTQIIFTGSDARLVCFTDRGNCVYVDLDDVDPSDYRTEGLTVHDICPDAFDSEKAVKLFTREEMRGDVLFFTKNGMVKRTPWEEYTLKKSYYQAIVLKEGDEVINVESYDTDEFSTMFFVSRAGFALNAVKDNLPVQGRVAGGVRGIALGDGGECIFASQINGEGEIVVVTAANGFKRVISSLIDPIGRACKGVIIADVKDCGSLLFADYVTIPYTLAVINKDGTVEELSTEEISIENRVTKGKKLKRNPPLDPAKIVPLKQKSDYSDGNVQMRI
ncbi:MAG TPA: DNA topoisomerase 4 subunit A [Candidatus Coproplasma stercoravium]|nr:DNA topoisomerase 4 subunit A [Candidatus Coproplasma stercoravium]